MATAVCKDPELRCTICLEKFNLPKILPCLHTFCEPCIQSYVQNCAAKEDNTSFFRCPLCRMKTDLINISATEWTKKLPTNYLITSLLDRKTNDDKQKEIHCDPCKFANEKNAAIYICKDCKEYLCEQCFNYLHKRKRDNNIHSVTIITPGSDLIPLEMDEPCPIHADKVLDIFCFDHEKICCNVCFATKHRHCDNVRSLDEIAKDKDEVIDMSDFLETISDATQCTVEALNKANEKLAQLADDKDAMLQSVDDIIANTKSHLDTLHGELRGSILKTFSNTEQSQEFDRECIAAFQKMLTQSQKLAEAVQEHGSRKEKFVNVEKTRMVIENDFERLCSTFNFSETSKRYDLHIEDKLKNVLNWSKIGSLNFQQSDEDPLTDIKTALCSLGCFNDYTVFQYSFSLEYALQVSPPFLLPKSQSKWRIEFHVINNNLGIYVNCISNDNSDWPLDVSVELSLVNQVDRKKDIVRTFQHLFTKGELGRGFKSIIDWQSLSSTEKGYNSNGWIKIKARLW